MTIDNYRINQCINCRGRMTTWGPRQELCPDCRQRLDAERRATRVRKTLLKNCYQIMACPDDTWLRGAYLPQHAVRETLKLGYFTPGMLLAMGTKWFRVRQNPTGSQRLVEVNRSRL